MTVTSAVLGVSYLTYVPQAQTDDGRRHDDGRQSRGLLKLNSRCALCVRSACALYTHSALATRCACVVNSLASPKFWQKLDAQRRTGLIFPISMRGPCVAYVWLGLKYILHLRKPKIRYDIGFSLGDFTKINVCFVIPFGVAVRGNATLNCLHWLFRSRGTLRCGVTPVLALTNVTFVTHFYPFWVAVRGKATCIGQSVLGTFGKPKVRYVNDFNLGSFI